MSLEIVHCKHCSGTTIPLDSVSINVELSKSKWCDHCNKMNTKVQNYFFCSHKCFMEYMTKVIRGESELIWKEWTVRGGELTYD